MASLLRLGEKFKQSVGITGGNKEWKPTSNARNNAMEQEVRRFAQELKSSLKAVKDAETALTVTINTFRGVLLAPLPKAHDETPAGLVPMDQQDRPIGLSAVPDGLTAATVEMSSSLAQRVTTPLEEWLAEYRRTKKQNEKAETLRLDLDKQRRDTACLQEKLAKQQAMQHKDTEATKLKAVNETDKLNRLAERYAEQEQEVFNAFLRLIQDSAVLRDIMAESVSILQRMLASALTSFNAGVPLGLPTLPEPIKPQAPALHALPPPPYPPAGGEMPGSSMGGSSFMTPEQAAMLSAGGFPEPTKPTPFPEPYKPAMPDPGQPMYGRPASPNGDAPPPYPAMHASDPSASGPPPPAWQPAVEPPQHQAYHPPEGDAAHPEAEAVPPPPYPSDAKPVA